MLDYDVETCLIDIISPHLPAGTVVRHAMAPPVDDETNEGLVVKATIETVEPTRTPRYIFTARFDYHSMASTDDLSKTEAALTALESALSAAPAQAPASMAAFSFFATERTAWDSTEHRLTGDRRENARTLRVTCIPVTPLG